jgi:hypothetical protein
MLIYCSLESVELLELDPVTLLRLSQNTFVMFTAVSVLELFLRLLNKRVEVLFLAADVQNGLRRSKSVGLGVIPNLLHKFVLEILDTFSSIFLILAYLRIFFLNCGSKKQFFLFKKNDKICPLGNFRQVAILNNFPKVSEFVAHDCFSNFISI